MNNTSSNHRSDSWKNLIFLPTVSTIRPLKITFVDKSTTFSLSRVVKEKKIKKVAVTFEILGAVNVFETRNVAKVQHKNDAF